MAEQDFRNSAFYKELLALSREQGYVTLLDIVAEIKKHKDAPGDIDGKMESSIQNQKMVIRISPKSLQKRISRISKKTSIQMMLSMIQQMMRSDLPTRTLKA